MNTINNLHAWIAEKSKTPKTNDPVKTIRELKALLQKVYDNCKKEVENERI